MWLVYAFGSALFAGATAVLAKMGIKNTASDVVTALRTGVVLVFAWLMVLVAGSAGSITSLSAKSCVFLGLSGLTTGASWICYFKALQTGDVNKVVPIDKSSTVLTMLLAFIILGEALTLNKVLGMIAISAGTFLMIERKPDAAAKGNGGWLALAILSAVFASLTSILAKIGIENVESNLGTALRTVVVLGMAWAIVFVRGKQKLVAGIDRKSMWFIVLSGIATGLSWLCYYRALQIGQASIVVPIDKLSIVVSVLFAYFAFKEKLTAKALTGLVLVVAGTLVLLVTF